MYLDSEAKGDSKRVDQAVTIVVQCGLDALVLPSDVLVSVLSFIDSFDPKTLEVLKQDKGFPELLFLVLTDRNGDLAESGGDNALVKLLSKLFPLVLNLPLAKDLLAQTMTNYMTRLRDIRDRLKVTTINTSKSPTPVENVHTLHKLVTVLSVVFKIFSNKAAITTVYSEDIKELNTLLTSEPVVSAVPKADLDNLVALSKKTLG